MSDQPLWVRFSPDGAKRLERLFQRASEGTLTEAETTLLLNLNDYLDYGEYSSRCYPSTHGDKLVKRYDKRKRCALAAAEEAWQAEQRAVERQMIREQQPD